MLVGAFMTDKTGYSKRKDVDSISACTHTDVNLQVNPITGFSKRQVYDVEYFNRDFLMKKLAAFIRNICNFLQQSLFYLF